MQGYKAQSKFFLRSPLLPLDGILKQVLEAPDRVSQRAQLLDAYHNKYIRDALYLASPVLYAELLKLEEGVQFSADEDKQLCASLMRYLSRMSTRCTPFGLFAGCTVGVWGDRNDVRLLGMDRQLRHTRPDMNYLCQLAQNLSEQPGIQEQLKFYPNNSHYRSGNNVRFIDYHFQHKQRVHRLAAVEYNEYLERLLQCAQNGATMAELAASIVDEDVSLEDAEAFVTASIEGKLFISELDATLSGPEMLERLIAFFERFKAENAGAVATQLVAIRDALANVDEHHDFGSNEAPYQQLIDRLNNVLNLESTKNLIQVDLFKPAAECTLDRNILKSVEKGFSVLNRISSRRNDNNEMTKFRQAFEARYETRTVPLLEALDVESGIAYNSTSRPDYSPLIQNIPVGGGSVDDGKINWTAQSAFWLQKIIDAEKAGEQEILLTDTDLSVLGEGSWNDLPDSFSVNTKVLALPKEEGDLPQIWLVHVMGTANKMIGRFTHLHPEIADWAKEIAQAEDNLHEGAVLAEIVHLPESRVGNILMRTQLRPYEIPYLAQSSVPKEQQIPLQDLLIRVSGGEIQLFSARLGKRVLPQLSNAHNFSARALPVYQFLCDLQGQQKRTSFNFMWGRISSEFSFLPRVKYQNVVLSRAQWQIRGSALKDLLQVGKTDDAVMLERAHAWKNQLRLPNRVMIKNSDNELLIDFNSLICVQTLLHEARKSSLLQMTEYPGESFETPIRDEEGFSYQHEILTIFSKTQPEPIYQTIETKAPVTLKRSFSLGSEWAYFKVYCGVSTADEMLANHIAPLVEALQQQGLISDWFFIRYGDPEQHFRLRFRVSHLKHIGKLIPMVYEYLSEPLEKGQIWKLMADTYEREVERYGATTMELSERLFGYDSSCILKAITLAPEYPEPYRWHFSLLLTDNLLNSFGFTLEQKLRIATACKDSFENEFRVKESVWLRKDINDKARTYRQDVIRLLERTGNAEYSEWYALAEARQTAIQPTVNAILVLVGSDRKRLQNQITSYIHMTVNRLFASNQRAYELMTYSLLFNYYNYVQHTSKKTVRAVKEQEPVLAEVV